MRQRALDKLEIAEDATSLHTTYERMQYHLIHQHGIESWLVGQRFQVELETIHERCHASDICNHTHDKPVRITGYELQKRRRK